MLGLVKKAFTDKNTNFYHDKGETVEFADARIKELAKLGYVDIPEAPKAEPKAEPKETPAKPKKVATKKK